MRVTFTKMQGAGNDFVVLDETQQRYGLGAAQYRFLAGRHFGVGADQILTVRPSPAPGIDFEYVIHNADGGEVEQCGNGARCFVRFVHDKGLTKKRQIVVETKSGLISPRLEEDGWKGPPILHAPARQSCQDRASTPRAEAHAIRRRPTGFPQEDCVCGQGCQCGRGCHFSPRNAAERPA